MSFLLNEFYFILPESAISSNFRSKLKGLIIEGKDQMINKMIFQKPLFLLMTQNYNILMYFAAHTWRNNLQVLNARALVNNL